MYGVALREKLLNLDDPVGAYMDEWADETYDGVTIRHLLEMRSGFEPNYSNHYGVYGSGDQLTYSLDRTPSWEPGQYFNYVNEDSMVLGGVLSKAFGREIGEVAQDEIFEPIGMNGAWWTDSEGASLTYCCIDSTARDLARFGLLFARNGEWDGNQIVPTDYVAESTTGISYHGYYGMQWWTYGEMFASVGVNGQYIWIYPEQDLIVARFGLYWQVGHEKVRDTDWANYHYTLEENGFQSDRFLSLVADAETE
jgi:CubicO group peptidase (beta-lactamase class C family)